ncbi:MAG: DUF3368 domain-containing protein [Verrucomicrobia bacterium]|nr:DUF3368 domain-containing protein [Verrucomicrobiota bacterium]
MIVVSDTTAITSLLKIQRPDLLRSLFSEIIIPDAVARELARRHPALPAFIQVRYVREQAAVTALMGRLDPGEAEAITLAKETEADALLIDDREGRVIAEAMGIRCLGLAGAMLLARQLGLISSLTEILTELELRANFRLAENIRTRLLDLADESPPP